MSVRRCVCVALLILCAAAPGCGPLISPMMPRLDEKQQQQVARVWDNMLSPPSRLDRQTLLDTLIVTYLYVYGVDRLHMVSEKYTSEGRVIMEVDCDRGAPDADAFTVTTVDGRGRTVRRERYTRAEVEESNRAMLEASMQGEVTIEIGAQPTTRPSTRPATRPRPEAPEERQRREALERRFRAVEAATQPARVEVR